MAALVVMLLLGAVHSQSTCVGALDESCGEASVPSALCAGGSADDGKAPWKAVYWDGGCALSAVAPSDSCDPSTSSGRRHCNALRLSHVGGVPVAALLKTAISRCGGGSAATDSVALSIRGLLALHGTDMAPVDTTNELTVTLATVKDDGDSATYRWAHNTANRASVEAQVDGGSSGSCMPIKQPGLCASSPCRATAGQLCLDAAGLPASMCRRGEWFAEYFASADLSGTPALNRCEAVTPTFSWGARNLGDNAVADLWSLLPEDEADFSVRWTGHIALKAGDYVFSAATAQGGVYVMVNDLLVVALDHGEDCATRWQSESHGLAAGSHVVVVEFDEYLREDFGGSSQQLNLTWTRSTDESDFVDSGLVAAPRADCALGSFYAEYFGNSELDGSNQAAGGMVSRCEATVPSTAWGYLAQPGLARAFSCSEGDQGDAAVCRANVTDGFSARWTGTFYLEAGDYVFNVSSGGTGVVTVDGEIVLYTSEPQIQPTNMVETCRETWLSSTLTLSAGNHELVFEYVHFDGMALVELSWMSDATLPGGLNPGAGRDLAAAFETFGVAAFELLGNLDFDPSAEGYIAPNLLDAASATSCQLLCAEALHTADGMPINVAEGCEAAVYDADASTCALHGLGGQAYVAGSVTTVAAAAAVELLVPQRTYVCLIEVVSKCAAGTFLAEYFSGVGIDGDAYATSCSSTSGLPAYNWVGGVAPLLLGGAAAEDGRAARWSGEMELVEGGEGHFLARGSNGGVQIAMDAVVVLDFVTTSCEAWQSDTLVGLVSGLHNVTIVFEHLEGQGHGADASLNVSWVYTSSAAFTFCADNTTWFSQYYGTGNELADEGATAVAETCSSLGLTLEAGASPVVEGAEALVDGFGARWNGTRWFEDGLYTFTIHAKNGNVALTVDGEVVAGDFEAGTDCEAYESTALFLSGYHELVAEYWHTAGEAHFNVTWLVFVPCPTNSTGEGNGEACSCDHGTAAPDGSGIPMWDATTRSYAGDCVSVPCPGNSTGVGRGEPCYCDVGFVGTPLWAEETLSYGALGATVCLPLGDCANYTYFVEYYDNVDLSGEPVALDCVVHPGELLLEAGATPSPLQSVGELARHEAFGVQWSGAMYVPTTGRYTLTMAAQNGGALLELDGVVVVEFVAGAGCATFDSSLLSLGEGGHSLVVQYDHTSGVAFINVSWSLDVQCPQNSTGNGNGNGEACACDGGFSGTISWLPLGGHGNVISGAYEGECSIVPCPYNASGDGHGEVCSCDGGYLGEPIWSVAANVYEGECVAVPCPGNSTGDGHGEHCACEVGWTTAEDETLLWNADANTYEGECIAVPCVGNSTGTGFGGLCSCNVGWQGEIVWQPESNAYEGTCEPVPCVDDSTGPGMGYDCICDVAFDGTPIWDAESNAYIGECAMLVCPNPSAVSSDDSSDAMFYASYFDNPMWNGTPSSGLVATSCEAPGFDVGAGAPPPLDFRAPGHVDGWSVRWTGMVLLRSVASGNFVFTITVRAAGAALYLDDVLVLEVEDSAEDSCQQWETEELALPTGEHALVAEYAHTSGDHAAFNLTWRESAEVVALYSCPRNSAPMNVSRYPDRRPWHANATNNTCWCAEGYSVNGGSTAPPDDPQVTPRIWMDMSNGESEGGCIGELCIVEPTICNSTAQGTCADLGIRGTSPCAAGQLFAEYFVGSWEDTPPVVARCEAPPQQLDGLPTLLGAPRNELCGGCVSGLGVGAFAVRWTGNLRLQGGEYTAVVASNGAEFLLEVDGEVAASSITASSCTSWHEVSPLPLRGGEHALVLEYAQADRCALAYCNDDSNPDLRSAYCGALCSTAVHAVGCREHWEVYGRDEGRGANVDDCDT
eukprot:SAG11_NODE_776_length_7223_cov_3.288883_1_plen_1843_part_01